MSRNPLPVIVADKIYRLGLFLYPRPFRRRFGYEMAQVFRDDTRHTLQQQGILSLIGLCFYTFFDLVLTAIAEHTREGIHMPLDKFVRFSGFAAFGAPILILSFTSNTFWDIVTSLRRAVGLPDGTYIHQLFIGIGAVLMAYALFGLYRRLSSVPDWRNATFFGLSIISCLFILVLSITFTMRLSKTANDIIYWGLLLSFVIGVAGMGWMTWRNRVLGFWSFAPLLIAGSFIAFALTAMSIGDDYNVAPGHLLANIEITLYTIGWWLLGVGLLQPAQKRSNYELRKAEVPA